VDLREQISKLCVTASFALRAAPFSPLQARYNSRVAAMRHLMPIITPRLVLRPPALVDLDSIQAAKMRGPAIPA
jgi:hypothetical protein